MDRVSAILWKKLNNSDIQTISGGMRGSVQGGGGQPDLTSILMLRLKARKLLRVLIKHL